MDSKRHFNISMSVKNLYNSTRPRPQTAVQQNSLIQDSLTQNQINLRDKYAKVTCLSPRSINRLKQSDGQKSYFSEIQNNNSTTNNNTRTNDIRTTTKINTSNVKTVKSASQTNNIRITNSLAEYAFEDLIDKEMKISEEEYLEFKRKYHRMVFDKKGNYLYTKLEPQTEDQQRTLKEIYQQKNTSQKFRKGLQEHQKNFQPEKIIGVLVKSAQEQASMHPRKKTIQEIKEKSFKCLNEMLTLKVKQKIIESAQNEIQKAASEMTSEIEKLLRENDVLKKECEKLKDTIVELQTQNENQNWKNQCFKKDIDQINNRFDILKKDSAELEKFIPQYKLLHSKFPEIDTKLFISKYEKLENLCFDLNKNITELEEGKSKLEQEKQELQKKLDQQIDQQRQNDTKKDNLMKQYLENLKEKEIELKDSEQYKTNYMILQKKLTQLFISWYAKTKEVYPLGKKDNGPSAEIKDPLEMLKTMENMIKISTGDKLQEYLRKIIVSANLLQRKYLPEYVNEKFDPDKIYERILKLINKLNTDNYQLETQVKQLKSDNDMYKKEIDLQKKIIKQHQQ